MNVNFKVLKMFETEVFLKIMVLLAIELNSVAIIPRMYITARILREVPYMKHRRKQVGFRYFVTQNGIAYLLFLCADIAVIILVPRFLEYNDWLLAVMGYKSLLYNMMYRPTSRLLNYATTAITAYVNLPADSVGFIGWCKGSNRNEEDKKEPLHLRSETRMSSATSPTCLQVWNSTAW